MNEEELDGHLADMVLEDDQNELQRVPRGDRSMIKLLISDNIAGAIIGKGGASISQLQNDCGARIKVSSNDDFYPGTHDRTLVISGPVDNVVQAQGLIWAKIVQFARPRGNGFYEENPQHASGKIVIPAEAGGLIIGKGGNAIRSMAEESKARIQLGNREDSRVLKERIITVSGHVDACIEATRLIILKLREEPSITYSNRSTSYTRGPAGGQGSLGIASQFGLPVQLPSGAETVSATTTITITIPDSMAGFILGKRRVTLNEIQSLSGATVSISPRDSAGGEEDGENDESSSKLRTVTITGSPASAQMAQLIISQKLSSASDDSARGRNNRRR